MSIVGGGFSNLASKSPVLSHELDEKLRKSVPGSVVFTLDSKPRFRIDCVTEVIKREGSCHCCIGNITQLEGKEIVY